jgi:hypothetical protein
MSLNVDHLVRTADTLEQALQASALPILVDVHNWAQLPLAFQRNIDAMYVELQAASSI